MLSSTLMETLPRATPVVVFLHIPKTAGTTFNSMLSQWFRPDEVQEIMMRGMSFRLPRFPHVPKPLVAPTKIRRLRDALASDHPPRLIRGHLDFSISRYLPADTEYITLLRHPVDRAVSHYYHYRRQTRDPGRELAMGSTLLEWVCERGLVEMDNGQTRRLAGEMKLPIGSVSADTLEKAKRNLATRFSLVGTTERFDEFKILAHRHFMQRDRVYPALNGDGPVPVLDAKSHEIVKQWNRFDLELHTFADELFRRAIAQADLGTLDPRKVATW